MLIYTIINSVFLVEAVGFREALKKKFKLLMRLTFCACITSISVPSTPAHAEVSKGDAARQMITQGKWALASTDTYGNTYFVDPYTIVKSSPNSFQINTLGPPINPLMFNQKEADHVRAQTIEFDCADSTWAHVGWRYPGGFRSRQVIGGKKLHKIDRDSIIGQYAKYVCPYESREGNFITAWGALNTQKQFFHFRVTDNTVFFNETKKIAYVKTSFADMGLGKYYIRCDAGDGFFQDPAGNRDGPYKLDTILLDWVCKGLHPSTVRLPESFEIPAPKVISPETFTKRRPPASRGPKTVPDSSEGEARTYSANGVTVTCVKENGRTVCR